VIAEKTEQFNSSFVSQEIPIALALGMNWRSFFPFAFR
jgi:hypothetical protein